MNCSRLLMAIVATAALTLQANGAVIDDFSDAGASLSGPGMLAIAPGSPVISTTDAVGGAAGGFRQTDMNYSGAVGASQSRIAGGQFFGDTPGNGGTTTSLTYDANGSGLNAQFDAAGSVTVDFDSFDPAGASMPVTVTLTDGGGNSATIDQTLTVAGPQVVNFAIAALTGGPVNLNDIDSISITFDAAAAQNFVLNSIDSTAAIPAPEPGSIGICGLFGAVCLYRRRSRRRQA